jgi:hydroxyacylglutathione hydrolase
LKFTDKEKFTAYMQDEQPVKPANILNIVAANQGRFPVEQSNSPTAPGLTPEQVQTLIDEGVQVVDTRSAAEYGAGHIPGSINIQMSASEFEQRVGWILPDNSRMILVTNTSAEAHKCLYNMAFIGMSGFVDGYLEDGIEQWLADGRRTETVSQINVNALQQLVEAGGQVLDTREQDEWDEGHIQGATLMPYTSLVPQLDIPARVNNIPFDRNKPVAVVCASGKRSSTAIGVLKQNGYKELYNVTGGMEAWENAGLKMLDGAGNVCKI